MSPTFDRFVSPLRPFQDSAQHQYRCHTVPDEEWVRAGLERVVGDHRSGCAFVQSRVLRGLMEISKSHYFESCKSPRRYKHLKSISEQFLLHHSQKALKDHALFEGQARINEMIKDFHLYAGDGHFHSASSHDPRDDKQVKNAIGHLYALNLRTQHLSHLALGSDGTCKKPHDMKVLKKLDIATLRQGATKGQKVLYIWDRAGIDFTRWHRWKFHSAIYFLSRVKKNMKLEHAIAEPFDREDPLNAGVIADETVGHSCGTRIRRVRFRVPETGEIMEFLTNLGPGIAPGLVAQLYFMRWRIEKSFDEIKNKLYETKAWAMSANAKKMQAAFIVLAYNLAQLLHQDADDKQGDDEPKSSPPSRGSESKQEQRLQSLREEVLKRGGQLPLLREIYRRPSQLGVKFYRWLRSHLYDPSPWSLAQQRLTLVCAKF